MNTNSTCVCLRFVLFPLSLKRSLWISLIDGRQFLCVSHGLSLSRRKNKRINISPYRIQQISRATDNAIDDFVLQSCNTSTNGISARKWRYESFSHWRMIEIYINLLSLIDFIFSIVDKKNLPESNWRKRTSFSILVLSLTNQIKNHSQRAFFHSHNKHCFHRDNYSFDLSLSHTHTHTWNHTDSTQTQYVLTQTVALP